MCWHQKHWQGDVLPLLGCQEALLVDAWSVLAPFKAQQGCPADTGSAGTSQDPVPHIPLYVLQDAFPPCKYEKTSEEISIKSLCFIHPRAALFLCCSTSLLQRHRWGATVRVVFCIISTEQNSLVSVGSVGRLLRAMTGEAINTTGICPSLGPDGVMQTPSASAVLVPLSSKSFAKSPEKTLQKQKNRQQRDCCWGPCKTTVPS